MSEEEVNEVVQEEVQEQEQEQPFDPSKDFAPVDDPEKVQQKINHLIKQIHASDKRNGMLTDVSMKQNEVIERLERQIAELSGRFEQSDTQSAREVLLNKIQNARDEGDETARDNALIELAKFDMQQEQKKQEKLKEPEDLYTQERYESDANSIYQLSLETNDNGELKRPWMYPNHPLHQTAVQLSAEIAKKYDQNDPQIVAKVAQELDYAMNNETLKQPKAKGNLRAPDPMSGSNLTNKNPNSKIKLSSAEMAIIERLNKHSKVKIDPAGYFARKGK